MAATTRFSKGMWLFLGYTVAVVLWGAFVRASLSGDGCGDHWPLCNGVVIPTAPTLKTKIELTHRITSGLCWFLALGFAIGAHRTFERGHGARKAALWVLALMTTEALIGAGLVIFRMVADNPAVGRAYWMGAHLTNTFVLLAAMVWTAWASADRAPTRRLRWPSWPLRIAVLGVLIVGITGAVAALGDTLFPAASLAEGLSQDASPTAHLFVRRRIWHPASALLVAAYLAVLGGSIVGRRDAGARAGKWLVALTVAQVGIGFANVLLLAPVWMQLVHLAIADAIWIVLVWIVLVTGCDLSRTAAPA